MYYIQLEEWYSITKCLTVALTLIGDKIYYSGRQLTDFTIVLFFFVSSVMQQAQYIIKTVHNRVKYLYYWIAWRDS